MSYKIVRLTRLYSEYLQVYYSAYPHIKQLSFKDQYEHLVENSVDAVSAISRNLRSIGTEAIDIFTNADGLQDKWKEENKSDKTGRELVFEQVKQLQPDVLWIDDSSLIDPSWILNVRSSIQSIKIITAQICAPYTSVHLKAFKALNFLFTCTPCLRQEFETQGINTYLVYHAFDKAVLNQTAVNNHFPETGLLFTGSLYTGGGFHKTRIEYLEAFLKAGLPVKIYGSIESTSKIASKKLAYTTINFLRKAGLEKLVPKIPVLKRFESYGDTPVNFYSTKLKANILPPVFGLDQYKLLSKGKICFNIHGEIAKGCAGNLRLFEATGLGSCLVTDWKKNMPELFEVEREVVTYKSMDECVEKMRWLIDHPGEVSKISRAGQLRTLKDHTFNNRAKLIHEILESNL